MRLQSEISSLSESDQPLAEPKAKKVGRFPSTTGEMPFPGFEPRHRNAEIGVEGFESFDQWIDELDRNAIEICRLWGVSFWNNNRNLYSVSGMGWEDLTSLCYDKVWNQRYRKRLLSGQYSCNTVRDFRAQFYNACHNNCKVHRRSLLAQKRYWEEGCVHSLSNTGKEDEDGVDVPEVVSEYMERPAKKLQTDFLKRSAEICAHMSLTAIRAHLLVLFKPLQYPKLSSLARRFGVTVMKLQQLINQGTDKMSFHASLDHTHTNITMNMSDKEAMRALVNSALHRGAIRQKTPGEQAAELLPNMSEAAQKVIYEMICAINEGKPLNALLDSLSGPRGDQRIAQFGARMAANLDIDYEILSAAIGAELNVEINPIIAWKLISSRLSLMSEEDRVNVLTHPYLGKLIGAIKHHSNGLTVNHMIDYQGIGQQSLPEPAVDEGENKVKPVINGKAGNGEEGDGSKLQKPVRPFLFIATRIGDSRDQFNFIPVAKDLKKVWNDINATIVANMINETLGITIQYPAPNRGTKGAYVKGDILSDLTTLQVQRMLNSLLNRDL